MDYEARLHTEYCTQYELYERAMNCVRALKTVRDAGIQLPTQDLGEEECRVLIANSADNMDRIAEASRRIKWLT